MLTPTIVEAALPSLPEPPGAVLVVSAFGAPPELAAWAAFEARHGIPVVFDAAAALTALSGIGTQPLCVSLHATKVLGIGEGGAILSADPAFLERTTAMSGFGFLGKERVSAIRGGNYRISEYAAAIGLATLEALPERLDILRVLTRGYRRRLAGKAARLQQGAGEAWVTMTLNVILPPEMVDATLARFASANVEWRHWWGLGCHRHPAFAELPGTDLSGTDTLAPCVIGLPFHDGLSGADLDRVASCLPSHHGLSGADVDRVASCLP
jgi:dTDP-4-amino-4,6-dideoxygalactose transaminase